MAMSETQLTLTLQEMDVDSVLSGASTSMQDHYGDCPQCHARSVRVSIRVLDTTKLRRRLLALLRGERPF